VMGSTAPQKGLPPSAQDIHDFEAYMRAVQSALKESPEKSKASLEGLEAKRSALPEVEQQMIPNPQKSNQARIDVAQARSELLQALSKASTKSNGD
jgi:hypothetical protein